MNIRVSIVEDDVPSRQILAEWLNGEQGFMSLSQFGSAEEGIEHLPQHKPNVVLMDIKLPDLSGIECVRQLKPRMPETQFVMLTVYEDSNHIFDALRAGATGYLLKGTTRAELLTALKYVHAGGSPMSSYIARLVVRYFIGAETEQEELNLSRREHEVLIMLARGFLFKEIADALNISVRTVDTYIRRIYEKLHVRSRAQAVARYANLSSVDGRQQHTL